MRNAVVGKVEAKVIVVVVDGIVVDSELIKDAVVDGVVVFAGFVFSFTASGITVFARVVRSSVNGSEMKLPKV